MPRKRQRSNLMQNQIRSGLKGVKFTALSAKYGSINAGGTVRQEYLLNLTDEYGYSWNKLRKRPLSQGAARHSPRRLPDLAHAEAKQKDEHALIVIECKADNVTISLKDYEQGLTTRSMNTHGSSSPTTTARPNTGNGRYPADAQLR